MRFADLSPQLVRLEMVVESWNRQHPDDGSITEITGPREHHVFVDTLAEAQGVSYKCPRCLVDKGGPAGVHNILTWFADRGVPDDLSPGPGRWVPTGNYPDLSFRGRPGADGREGARSVQITSGCNAHFTLTDGEIAFA